MECVSIHALCISVSAECACLHGEGVSAKCVCLHGVCLSPLSGVSVSMECVCLSPWSVCLHRAFASVLEFFVYSHFVSAHFLYVNCLLKF